MVVFVDFRSGVAGGAEDNASRSVLIQGAGESEIADLRIGFEIEENVGRFDVPVDDAAGMCMSETTGDGRDHFKSYERIDGLFVNGVVKGLSLYEFHDDKEHSIDVTKVIYPDEVGVVQLGHGLGLGFEGGPEVFIFAKFPGENFNGDKSIERSLGCAVDGTHSSLRNECFDLVGRKKRSQLLERGSDEFGRIGRCL